jgi:hypothetical protein
MSVQPPLEGSQPTPPIHGERTVPEQASNDAKKANTLVKKGLPEVGKHTTPPDARPNARAVPVTKEGKNETVENATNEALGCIALMFANLH